MALGPRPLATLRPLARALPLEDGSELLAGAGEQDYALFLSCAHTHSLGNGHRWEYGVAFTGAVFPTGLTPIFKTTSKQMLQALPHRRHQPEKGVPVSQPQGPLDTEANSSSPSQGSSKASKANRTRLTSSPEASALSAARGPCAHQPCTSGPAPPAHQACTSSRAPTRAALLQAPPFHSTARGDTGQAGPPGGGGAQG